jgi:hypothetical protein
MNPVRFPWERCHNHRGYRYRPIPTLVVVVGWSLFAAYLISSALDSPLSSGRTGLRLTLGLIMVVALLFGIGRHWLRRIHRIDIGLERELTRALGVSPSPSGSGPDDDPPGEPDPELPPDECDGNTLPGNDSAGAAGPVTTASNQWVTLNFGGTAASSQLAEIMREYSDGNARMAIKYYTQGHRQASLSFILSMIFAILGFGIVVVAVIGYIRNPGQIGSAVVTGVVGAVNEVVSFLFFQRADKSRELMMGLVDRLRDDREKERQFIGAVGTIDQVDDTAIKDALRAAVALKFAESPATLEEIAKLAASRSLAARNGNIPDIHIHAPSVNGVPEVGEETSAI